MLINFISFRTIVTSYERTFGGHIEHNATFQRASKAKRHYYYKVFYFTVKTDGKITFESNSRTDLFGLIYHDKFYPNNSLENLVALDDDGGSNYGFRIEANFKENVNYSLVVTTFYPFTFASFNIDISSEKSTPTFKPEPEAKITMSIREKKTKDFFGFKIIFHLLFFSM